MDIKSFVLGFLLGIILLLFIFLLTIYLTNRRFLKKTMNAKNIENKTIRQLISDKQKKIIKSPKLGYINNILLMQTLTKDLVLDIAKYYYPDSKYPHLEISLIEAIDMNERVLQRFKTILDVKIVGFLKNVRISQIISILEMKKNIENHKLYQISKKYRLDRLIRYGYTALNFTNPSYWLRRLIFTSTLETTLRSVAVMTLTIVGEESAELYGKKIIDNSDKILDKELQRFVKEIEAS